MYLWMFQAAVFPSFTDSTVVSETPAISPPQKTPGSELAMVLVSTTGKPHAFSFNGANASLTETKERIDYDNCMIRNQRSITIGVVEA